MECDKIIVHACEDRSHLSTMVTKSLILPAFLFSIQPGACAQAHEQDLKLAKDYVLAACIGAQYPGTFIDNETDAWAAALIEDGAISIHSYPKLEHLAKSAPPAQTSQTGVILKLKRCVDFINMPDFDAKLRKALNTKQK